jgi:hypothetical protein
MRCYGMKDVYETFACDYDEFGLFGWSADEKLFFENLFRDNAVHTGWIFPSLEGWREAPGW